MSNRDEIRLGTQHTFDMLPGGWYEGRPRIFTTYADLFESGIRYDVVSCDLPWDFHNWGADEPGMIHSRARGANKHYPTQTLQQLATMPPPLKPDGLLFFWTISSHIRDADMILAAWGLTPLTKAWTWIKTTIDQADRSNRIGVPARPRMGQGYTTRHATEDCWIASRKSGKRPAVRNEGDWIFELPRAHSQKPDQHFEKIERMYPGGLKLDMYGRYPRHGWDIFGNQIEESKNE